MSTMFYAFFTLDNGQIGYLSQVLNIQINEQTLFAVIQNYQIEVNKTKILYIDASLSYDLRKPNWMLSTSQYTFIWSIQTQTAQTGVYQTQNSRIFTLYPQDRTNLYINQPGFSFNVIYYQFEQNQIIQLQVSLIIQDTTRKTSPPLITQILISPLGDPNSCLTLGTKQINAYQIITQTQSNLMLIATISKNCINTNLVSLVWSCPSIDWSFWTYFSLTSNQTIVISRSNIHKLPLTKPIIMNIQATYQVGGGILGKTNTYQTYYSFDLLEKPVSIVPEIDYRPVINVLFDKYSIIDSSYSYDPLSYNPKIIDENITCTFQCPFSFSNISLCSYLFGCFQNISSSQISQSKYFQQQIMGTLQLFQLNIIKDVRQTITYFYSTYVNSPFYPQCNIIIESDNYQSSIYQGNNIHLNLDTILKCNCSSNVQNLQFQWSVNDFYTNMIFPLNQGTVVNNYRVRIPAYSLMQAQQVSVQVMAMNGTMYQSPLAIYQKINDDTKLIQGSLSSNFNYFSAYISLFQLIIQGWGSYDSYIMYYQFRIQESPNKYRVLISPMDLQNMESNQQQIPLIPLLYENQIYIDIIDASNNFATRNITIQVNVDQLLSPETFSIQILSIVNNIIYPFDENIFELDFYKLRTYMHAYANYYVNESQIDPLYFKTLCEQVIIYLNNSIIIDQNIDDIKSQDRKRIVQQHVIDILSFMTFRQKDLLYQQDMLNLLDQVTLNSDFSIGSTLIDTCSNAIQVIYSLNNLNQAFLIQQDSIFKRIITLIYQIMIDDEFITLQSEYGFEFCYYRITLQSIPQIFNIDSQIIKNAFIKSMNTSSFQTGFLLIASNQTFIHAQLLDQNMNQINIKNLNQNISIQFTLDQYTISKIKGGQATYYCQGREKITDQWNKTKLNIVSIINNNIICTGNYLGYYSLFIQIKNTSENSIIYPITPDPLNPNYNQQQNETGKWIVIQPVNNSYQNITIPSNLTINITIIVNNANNPLFYLQYPTFFTIALSITLGFFILSTYSFYLCFKNEKNDPAYIRNKQVILKTKDKANQQNTIEFYKIRLQLYKEILIQFNPYLNLFFVTNKFLDKWIRNMFIQIYYMIISIPILSIAHQSSIQNLPEIQNKTIVIIILFIIITCFRPILWKIMCKVFYEPDSKIEDSCQGNIIQQINIKGILNQQDMEVFDCNQNEKQFQLQLQDDNTKSNNVFLKQNCLPFEKQQNQFIIKNRISLPGVKQKQQDNLINNSTSLKRQTMNSKNTQSCLKSNSPEQIMTQVNDIIQNKLIKSNQNNNQEQILEQQSYTSFRDFQQDNDKQIQFQLEGGEEDEENKENNDKLQNQQIRNIKITDEKLPDIFKGKKRQNKKRNQRINNKNEKDLNLFENKVDSQKQEQPKDYSNIFNPQYIDQNHQIIKQEEQYNFNQQININEDKQQIIQDNIFNKFENINSEVDNNIFNEIIEDREDIQNEIIKSRQDVTYIEEHNRININQKNLKNQQRIKIYQNPQCYCCSKIGKMLIFLIWIILIVFHLLLIKELRIRQLQQWIYLSLIVFLVQIYVIDLILYFGFSYLITYNFKKTGKIQFLNSISQIQTNCWSDSNTNNIIINNNKCFKILNLLIVALIGKEKIYDLRRRIVYE